MFYQQNIRVQLQQRRNRLYKTGFEVYDTELRQFLAFIDRTPYLAALTHELEASHPELDAEDTQTALVSGDDWGMSLPDDELAAAKLCYRLLQECAASQQQQVAWRMGMQLNYGEGSGNDFTRAFTEKIADRYIHYLEDRLDDGSNILYVLEKYKRRTEWFHREELRRRMSDDTRKSEAVVDANLREYLFDQGIDRALSAPNSPSGRADVVADLGGEEPLVLEIKLFDPARTLGKRHIRHGFRQAYDYAGNFGQSTGYLVVFNCTDQPLHFETTAGGKPWPPRVEFDHRTIFLVVVDLVEDEASASKRPGLRPTVIREADLVSSEEPAGFEDLLTPEGESVAE